MAARIDAPVIGAQGPSACNPKSWQLDINWRYQKSDRHFVGTVEQKERKEEGSEVINRIHLADLGVRYFANDRWTLSAGLPYSMATRSSAIRNASREVIGRTITHATGIGDISMMARRRMFDPETSTQRNVSLGLGFKLPTGSTNVLDARQSYSVADSAIISDIRPVDQSIQPGDGGFGILLDVQAFERVLHDRAAFYAGATYLLNPQGRSDVLTYRNRPSEAKMSIADQYVVRWGASALVPGTQNWAASLGGRFEGVPSEDLIGPSDGFRRPGYAVSIEPGLSYQRMGTRISAAVPIAIQRDRVKSVSDKLVDGQGDAAFADWLLLVGISRDL